MFKRHFSREESTYFCQLCHRETRDTRGEAGVGLCALCFELSEHENRHIDEDHEATFGSSCMECFPHLSDKQIKHIPYFLGEKSYPTI